MPFPWKGGGVAALAAGLGVLPAAWAVDRAAGREVLLVAAADDASVDANRGLWVLNGGAKAEVPAIYGTPSKEAVRVVLAGEGNLLHPKEDPSLTLYLKSGDDHPLQSQTLYYFGVPTAIGGVLAGLALLFVARRTAKPA